MMDKENQFLQSTYGQYTLRAHTHTYTSPPISTTNHSDEPSLGHCLAIERTKWEEWMLLNGRWLTALDSLRWLLRWCAISWMASVVGATGRIYAASWNKRRLNVLKWGRTWGGRSAAREAICEMKIIEIFSHVGTQVYLSVSFSRCFWIRDWVG